MLNLNYNVNEALGGGNCRGEMKFNYSASILVAGGGAGLPPLNASQARGGGGAGFVWTGSLNIIPNISYQILVAETSSLGSNGNQSKFIGCDDNDTITFTVTSLGGQIQTGPNASGTYDGGPQGSGSLNRAGVVTNYAGFVGGLGTAGSRGGFNNFVGGGGAGARGNGGNGDINAPAGAQGGIGGIQYNAADFNPAGPGQNLLIGAGGSGESIGGAAAPQTILPSEYSQGASYNGTTGAKGGIVIKYAGEPKASITNGTTTTIGGFTYHTFNAGTGSFIFTYPYPWQDVVPYSVEVCPDAHNEDVRPLISWDYSSVSRTDDIPYTTTSSFATMSINAVSSDCIQISTVSNGGPFATDAQSAVTASITGSNWPTGSRNRFGPLPYSITMSLTTAGITYDPLAVNQYYSASIQFSGSQIQANPNITGSVLTNVFLASEFYRFYVNGSTIMNIESALGLNQDPYSASLVLAIPGTLTPGYGMQSFRSDISSYIRGTGTSFSDAQLPITSSGVPSFGTGSFEPTTGSILWGWYDTSIQITGSNGSGSLVLEGNATASQFKFNSSSFTIEAYVNYQNEQIGGYTMGSNGPAKLNGELYWNYDENNPSSGGSGFVANGIEFQNPGVRFLIVAAGGGAVYYDSPQKNRAANTWYHIAGQRSGSLFSSLWNGTVVQSFTFAGALATGSSVPFNIMGQGSTAHLCHRYQDYRIYNGIGKYPNATSGSTYTQPISIFSQP